jgi:hypothetical protein
VIQSRASFLRRLAALVPPPRTHLLAYHGVFAARSKLRRALSPAQPEPPETDAAPRPQLGKPRSENRIPWAELIRRVFLIDLLTCDKCGGLRDVRAIVPKAKAREVLEALAIPFMSLSIAKARDLPSQDSFELGSTFDGVDPVYPDRRPSSLGKYRCSAVEPAASGARCIL